MQTMKVNKATKMTKRVKFDGLKPEEKYTVREDATAISSSKYSLHNLPSKRQNFHQVTYSFGRSETI